MGQKLGQHFLIKESILTRIAEAACPQRAPVIIEIGPGKGALTAKLLDRAECVIAIEVDPQLASYLREKFATEPRLTVVQSDVLETDLTQWGRAPIAGNLPYYITSPIISRVVRLAPPRAIFLVQKEVADRLAARPGSRDYGFLTVSTQIQAEVRKLFEVKPGAFQPPPKVDSAVVELLPKSPAGIRDLEEFIRFVGRCFEHKRKTLRNNLARVYGDRVNSWPEASLRAEQIPIHGFREMFDRVRFHEKLS